MKQNILLNSWQKYNKFSFLFTTALENKWFKITRKRTLSRSEHHYLQNQVLRDTVINQGNKFYGMLVVNDPKNFSLAGGDCGLSILRSMNN